MPSLRKFVIPTKRPGVSNATPVAVRQARSRAVLAETGGRTISIGLPPGAVADLEHIRERDGSSIKYAIIAALKRHARR